MLRPPKRALSSDRLAWVPSGPAKTQLFGFTNPMRVVTLQSRLYRYRSRLKNPDEKFPIVLLRLCDSAIARQGSPVALAKPMQ